ncbi:hypothetical protein PYW08_001146 [Mythimna loreyi]|uniref:Uncharacterized protein n=1 Tax=Mythimna loreyi TaxID=667449 RepID=A0ACC2R0J4_9NEOP|nr:hypothetical protein PYW08_001146 [Mythimna loreyi]
MRGRRAPERSERARPARLCRWRAAGARKKASRQMRDAARRTAPPPPAPGPREPRRPQRARTRVGSSARGGGVRWRGVCAGAGGAWRARGAGGARAAARAAVARRQAAARVALRSLAARCIAALAISRQGATIADVGDLVGIGSVRQSVVLISA